MRHVDAPDGSVRSGAGRLAARLGFALLAASGLQTAGAQVSVLTQDYDNLRSGANLAETVLTPASVSSATFGKLFAYPVDEEIFAQPLYVPGVTIDGATHNVVIVATMGNTVYAFDADNPATAAEPLWSVNLGTPIPTSRFDNFAGSGVSRNGIYSTPVIDPAGQTVYVVSHLWDTAGQSISLQLHALSLLTGAEKFNGPVTLAAKGLNPNLAVQRAGLLLAGGILYVAQSSHADLTLNMSNLTRESYVGMVIAYNAQTLAQVATFNAEPGGVGSAIWQGGRGLAYDGNYVYAMTANALKTGSPDYSHTFLQLKPATLALAGSYQDPDAACLNTLDLDLGASGPQLILNAGGTSDNLLMGGGKEGKVYQISLNQALNAQTPPYFWGTSQYPTLPAEGGTCTDPRKPGYGWLKGSNTAVWNPGGAPTYFYTFGDFDEMMSFEYSSGQFASTSVDTPAATGGSIAIAVSANGALNGILWTLSKGTGGMAQLSAYNALPSGGHLTPLWNSQQVPTRDSLGLLGRNSVPTVANGKVYVATGSNQVAVYGLLPAAPSVQLSPTDMQLNFTALNANTETINVNALGGFTGKVTLSVADVPTGYTASLSKTSLSFSSTNTSYAPGLTVTPVNPVFPIADTYTLVVQAVTASGAVSTTPVRLFTRNAAMATPTKIGCNSSNQMDATVYWDFTGTSAQSIWVQDSTTPDFPGRALVASAAQAGSAPSGYIVNKNKNTFVWAVDQSGGAPANFDNALQVRDLVSIYSCP